MRKRNPILAIAVIATIGFSAAFAYNVYLHVSYFLDARTTREDAAAMQDLFASRIELIHTAPAVSDDPEEDAEPFDSPIFAARELTDNDDIIAYIHIEGTNISNVVLQDGDNLFYLHHDMHRQRNANGSLFLDFKNSPDFTDRNSIVYGHNMNNGTMFHNLRYFMNADYFNANRYITVFTETEMLTYQIFAALSTRTTFEYIQIEFYDDDDFLELVSEIKQRSVHNSNITVGADDRIIILSTCTNTADDMRFVVAGVLLTE
ncbi:MAG: class B sortase [Defluviitaleaceae bacterium]|nr:class B sortase [Defluviitaleaceae bacterium]